MRKALLLLLLVPVVASAGLAVYFLSSLDSLIHGTLYNYGLQFSYEWASPYWSTLRMVQVLIGLTAILSVFSFILSLFLGQKMQVQVKPKKIKAMGTIFKADAVVKAEPKREMASERKIAPQPTVRETKPEPSQSEAGSADEKLNGLFRCNHCNRVFAQPLRMLDFHANQPRIISICPFCNEVIQPAPHNIEGDNGKKLAFLRRKNGNGRIQVHP
jgi:hypothetical protein